MAYGLKEKLIYRIFAVFYDNLPRERMGINETDNIMIVPKYEIFAKVYYHVIVIAPGLDATTLFNVII
jgi:hypothetical protein